MVKSRTFVLMVAYSVVLLLGGAIAVRAAPKPATSIPAAALMQPAELAAALRDAAAPRALILQVGFRSLYEQAHIAGAEYVGGAGEEAGLEVLRHRVAKLPKDALIVIYCGCCPWSHCPNIAAAYETLRDLGFTRMKVLFIPDNFGADWVEKNYPVTKGS